MTRLMTKWMAVAVAALAAGCGGAGTNAVPEETADTAQGLTAEVRLRAVKPEGFDSVLVRASHVEVRALGQVVPVDVAGDFMDLANADHAWLLGTVQIPEGAQKVEIAVFLDEMGAFGGTKSGDLDVRSTVIRWESPVAFIQQHNKAVVEVDVSRTLTSTVNETLAVVPQYRILY